MGRGQDAAEHLTVAQDSPCPPTITQPQMSTVLRLSPMLQHTVLGNEQHEGNKPEKLIKKPDQERPYSLCQGSFFFFFYRGWWRANERKLPDQIWILNISLWRVNQRRPLLEAEKALRMLLEKPREECESLDKIVPEGSRGRTESTNTSWGCKSQQILGTAWIWEGQGGLQGNSQVSSYDYWMDDG